MDIQELVRSVSEISTETNYWFVRTDDGRYFESFTENGFIGIGWNYISLIDVSQPSRNQTLREKIRAQEQLDATNPKTKSKVTTIINKVRNFAGLRNGDVIVIPSSGSSRFAFGKISDDAAYSSPNGEFDCPYQKRRTVSWLAIKNFNELDPNFYRIKSTRHAISQVNEHSVFIDNVISSLYIKDDNAHFVLDINKQEDINVDALVQLISNCQLLINKINDKFNFNEDISHNSIRLNLQSPGKIEFKLPSGKSLIIMAIALSMAACENQDEAIVNHPELREFITENSTTLNEIDSAMNDLEVDRAKINSYRR
jgi:restriction system protein